jgi:CSLREA domain-containing protein
MINRPSTLGRRFRPRVEPLEDRLAPAVITVTSTDDTVKDDKALTLREAISIANRWIVPFEDEKQFVQGTFTDAPNTIQFHLTGRSKTIHLTKPLDSLLYPVVIDGTSAETQPGTPVIELDGSGIDVKDPRAIGGVVGLDVRGGSSIIEGLILNGFRYNDGTNGTAIQLWIKGGDRVLGNYIGTNAGGTRAAANDVGVLILNVSDNQIADNVISGNANGIDVYADANDLTGNSIGTDAAGMTAVPNNIGVVVLGSANHINFNRISGNESTGLAISGSGATKNVVANNLIGTDVRGSHSVSNGAGISIGDGAHDNTIGGSGGAGFGSRNVISGNTTYGIWIDGPDTTGTVIQGNFIGTDLSGAVAITDKDGVVVQDNGIRVQNGAGKTIIGGSGPGEGNVISGNHTGVSLDKQSTDNTIQGNYLGTDQSGTRAIGNGFSISVEGDNNLIGGTDPGAGNVISGNFYAALTVYGNGNTIQGNNIGTDATGKVAIPNDSTGLFLAFGASNNIVGGTDPGAGNVIAGNNYDGVYIDGENNVLKGNFIGTDRKGVLNLGNKGSGIFLTDGPASPQGAHRNQIGGVDKGEGNVIAFNGDNGVTVKAGTGNSIRGNSILANGSLGIDLGDDGVTPNSANTMGPNRLQHYPILPSVTSADGLTTIKGTLTGTPGTSYDIDFYADSNVDSSHYSEGKQFLGSKSVTTDGQGNATFTATYPTPDVGDQYITATATDRDGNTSEFSPCRDVLRNSLHRVLAAAPPWIIVQFIPNFGLSLDQAAAICGVDHFNWINQITYKPADWTFWRFLTGQSPPQGVPIIDLSTFYDPDTETHGGIYSIGITATRITPRVDDVKYPGLVDDKIFYGNEPMPSQVGKHVMEFDDKPAQPDDFLNRTVAAGDYIGFKTKLAGVNADLTPTVWEGLQTNFTWKSNATYDHTKGERIIGGQVFDVNFFSTLDDTALPPVIAGGVFDVQFPDGLSPNSLPVLNPIDNQVMSTGSHVPLPGVSTPLPTDSLTLGTAPATPSTSPLVNQNSGAVRVKGSAPPANGFLVSQGLEGSTSDQPPPIQSSSVSNLIPAPFAVVTPVHARDVSVNLYENGGGNPTEEDQGKWLDPAWLPVGVHFMPEPEPSEVAQANRFGSAAGQPQPSLSDLPSFVPPSVPPGPLQEVQDAAFIRALRAIDFDEACSSEDRFLSVVGIDKVLSASGPEEAGFALFWLLAGGMQLPPRLRTKLTRKPLQRWASVKLS